MRFPMCPTNPTIGPGRTMSSGNGRSSTWAKRSSSTPFGIRSTRAPRSRHFSARGSETATSAIGPGEVLGLLPAQPGLGDTHELGTGDEVVGAVEDRQRLLRGAEQVATRTRARARLAEASSVRTRPRRHGASGGR